MAENYYPQGTDSLAAFEKEYQEIQAQYDEKQRELQTEIDNIRRHFYQQAKPHFEKRDKYLNTIKSFWSTAFLQLVRTDESLQPLFEPNTEEAFTYLKSLSFVDLDDGFKMVLVCELSRLRFCLIYLLPLRNSNRIRTLRIKNWKRQSQISMPIRILKLQKLIGNIKRYFLPSFLCFLHPAQDILHILQKEAKRALEQQQQEEIEMPQSFFQVCSNFITH